MFGERRLKPEMEGLPGHPYLGDVLCFNKISNLNSYTRPG